MRQRTLRGGRERCRGHRFGRFVLAALLALGATPAPAPAADPPGTALSREALGLCHRAQSAAVEDDEEDKEALLRASLERAEAAIEADEDDALAHFARFCALGEQAKLSGASLSSLLSIWAIRDAIDDTLRLAPDYPDALLGKGAFLASLPRLLGGDPEEGERLVRRALAVDPNYIGARLFLAELLAERGDIVAARREAERALETAERKEDPESMAKARRLLATLDGTDAG